jgi:putative hydrolase of the HAD superfamily
MMTRPHLGIREALAALERGTGLALRPPSAREALIRTWNEASAATVLYDDVLGTLDDLRPRYRLGILSNTQSFDLDFLRTRGLSARMDALCLSCHEGRLKPDPLIFAAAASRLGLEPGQVLMIGDSEEDDVAGAVRAGLGALHLVRDGPAAPARAAPGTLRGLTGLPALLASGRSGSA